MKFFIVFCCEIFFIAAFNSALAAPKTAEGPTRIRSDIIDIKRKSQVIDFLQNVVVEKGDSSLLAQKMTLLYDEEQKREGKSAVKRIDAWDNVKIFSEDFIASGDEGHYDPQKDIFVLEKNVVVNNGSSIASGEKFIYDLTTKKGNFIGRNEETSIVRDSTEPQDRRVVVVIGGELKDQKKQKKKSDEQNIKRQ